MQFNSAVIVRNENSVAIPINDLGIAVPANGELLLSEFYEFEDFVDSDDLKRHVENGVLLINDGVDDLEIVDAIEHLRILTEYSAPPIKIYKDGVLIQERMEGLNFIGNTIQNITDSTGIVNVDFKEFIDSTSGELTFWDETRNKKLGSSIIEIACGRNSSGTNYQYLRTINGVPMNLTGIPLPYDATLVYFTMSNASNTKTWTAEVRKNDTATIIDSLTITNQWENHTILKNGDFYAGDRIQVYCNGSARYPQVRLYFRRRY